MTRTTIFALMLGMALLSLTGCATTEYGSVSDSVTAHMNCREETKAYMGGPDEIEMFMRCMEKHGYAPDGKPLAKPASTPTATSQ